MTELFAHRQNIFIGLFGKKAGLKLLHWLDPCCTNFCDDVKECVGITSSGDASLFLTQTGTFASPQGETVATVNLTSSQILALNSTPVQLIAAPGAGKAIIVDEILFKMNFVTSAYTGSNAVNFKYTDNSGQSVAAAVPSSILDIASGSSTFVTAGSTHTLTANAPVVAVVGTADPAAGGGNATLTIKYRIVTL